MVITGACFSPDGSQLFLCGQRPSLYTYEVASGKVNYIRAIVGHTKSKSFLNVLPSPNGNYVILLGDPGHLVVISAHTKRWLADLKGASNRVYSAVFASDGRLFASYDGGLVLVWNVDTRTCVHRFTHMQPATRMDISPNGQYLAFGTAAGLVDIFLMQDLVAGGSQKVSPHISIANLTTAISTVKFNADTQILAIASDERDNAVRFVHVPSFKVFSRGVPDNFRTIKCVSFAPDKGTVWIADAALKLQIFEIPDYSRLKK